MPGVNLKIPLARELSGESYANLGPDRLGFVLREPTGVVSMVMPWNFPLLIVSQKLPFALAAGCTCVVKPSEIDLSFIDPIAQHYAL